MQKKKREGTGERQPPEDGVRAPEARPLVFLTPGCAGWTILDLSKVLLGIILAMTYTSQTKVILGSLKLFFVT